MMIFNATHQQNNPKEKSSSSGQVIKDRSKAEASKKDFKSRSQLIKEKKESAMRWNEWEYMNSVMANSNVVGPSLAKILL